MVHVGQVVSGLGCMPFLDRQALLSIFCSKFPEKVKQPKSRRAQASGDAPPKEPKRGGVRSKSSR